MKQLDLYYFEVASLVKVYTEHSPAARILYTKIDYNLGQNCWDIFLCIFQSS